MTDTLFYNVWRTNSPEDKASLIEAMRDEAPHIAAKPGFRSMTVLEGEDDRILVEGRWASRAAFEAAIAMDADAQRSRHALEAFGKAEPALFSEAFRVAPLEEATPEYPSRRFWDSFQRKQVEINGLKLNVVRGGEGAPVLLIHGFLETWAIWHRLMPMLARRYCVIAPDLRGFGDSEGNGKGYDKKTLAADMVGLLDALGVARAHAVGHDFGGEVAYALAAARPDRVATLTVIETALPGIDVSRRGNDGRSCISSFHSTPDIPELLVLGREREYVRALWDLLVEPDSEVSSEDRAEMERLSARASAITACLEVSRAASQDIVDLSPCYGRDLAMPVLALGSQHGLEMRVMETFRQVASNVTGGSVEGTSYFVPMERSEATATPMLGFLELHPINKLVDERTVR